MKITILWRTGDHKIISKIRSRFGLPTGMTINGEQDCTIKDDEMDLFMKCAKYFIIKNAVK